MMNTFVKGFLFSLMLFVNHLVCAATYTWTGGTGTFDWSMTSGSWSTSGVPDSDDDVVITGISGTLTYTNASGVTLGSLTVTSCTDLGFGMDVTVSTGTLTITDSEVSFSGDLTATGSGVSITSTVSSPSYGTIVDVMGDVSFSGGGDMTFAKLDFHTANTLTINTSGKVTMAYGKLGDFSIDITCSNISYTVNNEPALFSEMIIDGEFTFTSKYFRFLDNVFNGDVVITKSDFSYTSTNSTNRNEGNTFYGVTELINNDDYASLVWGVDDNFWGSETTIRKNGIGAFYIGYNSTGAPLTTASFKSKAIFYNEDDGNLYLSYLVNSKVVFESTSTVDVLFYNNGAGQIHISELGPVVFSKANVVVGNLNSNGRISFGYSTGATEPIEFTSTADLTVYSDASSAPLGFPYFSEGMLYFDRVIFDYVDENEQVAINQSATAQIYILPNCVFDRKLEVSTGRFSRIGGTFKGETVFINLDNSAGYSTSMLGTTTFSNHVSFISHSAYFWYLANVGSPNLNIVNFNSDEVAPEGQANVLVHQEGNGQIALGYQNGTFNFSNVLLTLKRYSDTKTPGYINVAYVATMTVNLDAQSSVKVVQPQINSGIIRLGYGGLVTHYGTIDASEQTGDLFVLNYFTSKNSDLEIITSPSAGNSTTVSLSSNCTFEGDLEVRSPGITSSGGLYKGNTILNRFGSTTGQNVHTGSPVYKGDLTLKNESEGNLWLATGASDVFTFEKNVYIIQGTGTTKGARLGDRGICNYYGNLSYDGTINSVLFGANGGQNIFVGSTDQTISTTGANAYRIGRLEVDKPSGNLILNAKVLISNVYNGTTASYPAYLALKEGNIVSTSAYSLTLNNDATISGGGKHSFIEGPCSKQGDDAFTFPIGKPGRYYPVSMTTPSNNSGAFTAEFFYDDIPVSSSKSAPLQDLLDCQYWNVSTNGTATTSLTFCWHNESAQNCEPVDANTVSVARYNGSSWVDEGANALVSSPGDSGTVRSNTQTTFGYYTLGATLANTITPNDVYAVLKRKMDGGYYNVIDENLYFKFEHEYSVSESSTLSYTIFDEQHAPITMSSAVVKYGDNRYAWNVEALTAGKYYLLEVRNVKGEKWVLLFKV